MVAQFVDSTRIKTGIKRVVSLCAMMPLAAIAQSPSFMHTSPTALGLSTTPSSSLSLTPTWSLRVSPLTQTVPTSNSLGFFSLPDQYTHLGSRSDLSGIAVDSTVEWGAFTVQPFGVAASDGAAVNEPLASSLPPSTSSSMVGIGANLSRDFATNWGRVTPYASVNLQQQSQSEWDSGINSTEQRFHLGMGFETAFSRQAKAFMSYETSLSTRDQSSNQQVYAGLLFNF